MYEKLNIRDGDILTAEHLAHIEQGIAGAYTGIQYVESAVNGKEKVDLRDLESGVYMIYGYFSPYKDSNISIGCNDLIHVAHKDAGSHIMCISPLNAKITFFEILVDESNAKGFTYTRQSFDMLELHGLIARVEALEQAIATETDNTM